MFLPCFLLLIAAVASSPISKESLSRSKREAYVLPEGAELLVGDIRSTFQCFSNGYYADVENNCQIFHVCSSLSKPDGTVSNLRYSFVCGNQTVFNQLTFTCTYPEDAVPCIHAQDFYYLNSNLETGDPDIHFLSDQDIQRAAPLIDADHYSRRVEKPQPVQPYNKRRLQFGDYAAKK